MAVVDLALPAGRWLVPAPITRLACSTSGVDLHDMPWRWVGRDLGEVEQQLLRGGHIRVPVVTVAPATGDNGGQRWWPLTGTGRNRRAQRVPCLWT